MPGGRSRRPGIDHIRVLHLPVRSLTWRVRVPSAANRRIAEKLLTKCVAAHRLYPSFAAPLSLPIPLRLDG